jgi:hypothetical protein
MLTGQQAQLGWAKTRRMGLSPRETHPLPLELMGFAGLNPSYGYYGY